MSGVSLIMPMAGRGSRFVAEGIREPKPLIDLDGKPFFWWAAESARRAIAVERMVFVVLEEHNRDWSLDRCIREFYPAAEVVAIADVTTGSAETAAIGARELEADAPIMINDCDHAFVASTAAKVVCRLGATTAGALMTFKASSPGYSYVRLGDDGEIAGTVEKQVASDYAIAGCYLFRSAQEFQRQYERYVRECPYPELFISGMYDQMLAEGLKVEQIVLDEHFAFGTPGEYANVRPRMTSRLAGWRQS